MIPACRQIPPLFNQGLAGSLRIERHEPVVGWTQVVKRHARKRMLHRMKV